MKKVLVTALTLALAGAASAAVAETIKYTTKDHHAYAGWHLSDDCSYFSLDVSANEYATRQTGSGPVSGSYVGVYYSSSNWCTGEYHYQYAYGDGTVKGGAKSVTVQANLESYNYMTGETGAIAVDLIFVGNGEYTSKGVSNFMSTSGPVRTRSRSVGSSESADVTGTVTLNGTDMTTDTPAWGWIGRSNHGSTEIVTPYLPR